MAHLQGTFSWADVAVPDTDAAGDFYTRLFGWDAAAAGPSDSMPYTMFSLDGESVAGMGPLSQEQQDAGQPPVWSAYIAVDDADATAAKAAELGATVVMEPFDVPGSGRMFFAIDPVGAAIGFWQAGGHAGAGVLGSPGAMAWNELACRDVDAAKGFYTELLGLRTETQDYDGFLYTTLHLGDQTVGGMYDMSGYLPDELPAHWFVWFAVSDTDTATAKTQELGGTVQREPWDTQFGRMAVLSDPQGATFGVITVPMEH